MPIDAPDPQGDSELLPTFEKLPEDHRILDGRIIDAGLRAWLVVRGATCNNTATWGLLNSWGISQAYYGTKALISISPSRMYIFSNFTSHSSQYKRSHSRHHRDGQ
ncbi:hypothetical protein C8J56DRAFT_1065779 [Mycena floridula]|nr:hypothetical protein C8J56DRAFT_1065779 [Mycena floridula]